jgi:hypothetical protein
MWGLIYLMFSSKNTFSNENMIVQPHLEYAWFIWAPMSSAGLQKGRK